MVEALLQALISGLAVGGAYALVALGFSITFTTTKTLNFSHGEFVSAGAFIGMSALFLVLGKPLTSTSFGADAPGGAAQLLALVAALGIMGALGALLYVLGVRPFAGRPGMAWVMSTLGFGVILQSIGLAIWGPKPVVVPGPAGDDVMRVLGIGVRPQELLMLGVAVVIMVAFDWVIRCGAALPLSFVLAYSVGKLANKRDTYAGIAFVIVGQVLSLVKDSAVGLEILPFTAAIALAAWGIGTYVRQQTAKRADRAAFDMSAGVHA